MALVFQLCETCGTRYSSRTVRSKHCSSACRQRSCRAAKQQTATPVVSETPQQNQMKSHEGNNEMKESQLFQPDAAHLQALQDIAVKLYREATQCNIDGMQVMGMTEVFEVKTLQATLDRYAELIGQGYTPSTQVGHVPKLVSLPLFDFFTLHLQKPAAQVEADIAKIKAEVESRYLEQLTQAKLDAVEKEVDSLIRGARDKRADAEAKAKAAADIAEYERVKAEVLAALGGE